MVVDLLFQTEPISDRLKKSLRARKITFCLMFWNHVLLVLNS